MALVLGTNAGFVISSPSADPAGTNLRTDNVARGFKDTTPAGATTITEIGWYCDNATEESNFEVGIYTHNVGDNNHEAKVGSFSTTNAKGTTAGWKKVTGLSIPINENTIYWIGFQLDTTSKGTNMNRTTDATKKTDWKFPVSELDNPWGVSNGTLDYILAIYAVYSSAPTPTVEKKKLSGSFATRKEEDKIIPETVPIPTGLQIKAIDIRKKMDSTLGRLE